MRKGDNKIEKTREKTEEEVNLLILPFRSLITACFREIDQQFTLIVHEVTALCNSLYRLCRTSGTTRNYAHSIAMVMHMLIASLCSFFDCFEHATLLAGGLFDGHLSTHDTSLCK